MAIVPLSGIKPLDVAAQGVSAQSKPGANMPFAEHLTSAVQSLRETQQAAQQDAYDLALGRADDLTGIMINSAKESTALKMTVELTSRAVNAYKEIMQMQI